METGFRDKMRFHITPYLRRQMRDHPPQFAFSAIDRQGWIAWRQELRGKLRDLLGPWPERSDLTAEIVRVDDAGDHWREDVVLSSHSNLEIPCYLLIPKAETGYPRPAILALHGHGGGMKATVGRTRNKDGQSYGLQMVRAGYVVLAFDAFPFGTRKETDHNAKSGYEYACNSTFIRSMLWGYNLLTLNTFDAFRTIDYLETRPEVDPERIGVMGCSYGGTRSMYAAILDRRIKAAVLSCSLGEYRGHGIELDELCGAQVVPGILQWAEMGDVAGLLAPMPLLTESARGDVAFPWSFTEPTLKRLREVYHVAGVQDHLVTNIYDGGHRYYGGGVPEFFGKYL